MSWLTNLFKETNNSAQRTAVSSGREEYKPFTVGDYLGFYDMSTVFACETFAKRSLFTGEYIHVSQFMEKEERIADIVGIDERFQNFTDAYNAFCEVDRKGFKDDVQFLMACNSLVIMFNKQYRTYLVSRPSNFKNDYPRYFRIVKWMLCYNLPILIKADLFRQISFFEKCIEILNGADFKTEFERELCDEIRLRAFNNIRQPFMICDVDELRPYINDPDRPTALDWYFNVRYKVTLGTPIYRIAQGGESWGMATR